MNKILLKIIDKFFFRKWIIGIFRGDIKDLIRSKSFTANINWLPIKPYDSYYADPFIIKSGDDYLDILVEDFSFEEDYGKLALMTLDKNFKHIRHKILLDTKSHLSYPFFFKENDKFYIFPEAGKSGKVSCYEYDPVNESVDFIKDLIDLPLCDSSVLKQNGKYWIFGTLSDLNPEATEITDYKLCVFFSDNLLGPYFPHPNNPVKCGLNRSRQAGNFIEVDGVIYRPTQNCKNQYGESITITKITELNEHNIVEEPYMTICIDKKNQNNFGMNTIHTINSLDNIIVVDGMKLTFAPLYQIWTYLRDKGIKRLKGSE
jgi:hypothetical protein